MAPRTQLPWTHVLLCVVATFAACKDVPPPSSTAEHAGQPATSPPTAATSPPHRDAICEGLVDTDRLAFCGPRVAQEAWGYATAHASSAFSTAGRYANCLAEVAEAGTSRVFPPLEAKCGKGPKRHCEQSDHPSEPWHFAPPDPKEYPVWALLEKHELGYSTKPVFHGQIEWKRIGDDCAIIYKGVADLDDDGVYGTYEDQSLVKPDGTLGFYDPPDGTPHIRKTPEADPTPIPKLPPEIATDPDRRCDFLDDPADRVFLCGPNGIQQLAKRVERFGSDAYNGALPCVATLGKSQTSGYWPPRSIDCVAGPKHRCVAAAGAPTKAWEFALATEEEDPVWACITQNDKRLFKEPIAFHSKVSWETKGAEVIMSFEAVADLNRDGKLGSSTSSVAFDKDGKFLRVVRDTAIVPE